MSPRYDYRCPDCGRVAEVKLPMNHDGPVQICFDCESFAERVYTPTAALIPGGTPIHHDRAWLRGPGGKSQEKRGR